MYFERSIIHPFHQHHALGIVLDLQLMSVGFLPGGLNCSNRGIIGSMSYKENKIKAAAALACIRQTATANGTIFR